jgi:acetyl-CoA/propionyl-CoA carboxylase biotin carboxyl carrier protein
MPRILIANRGEIATRVIRACSEHGHTSIAVYADQDVDAMHTQLADEAYALGGTRVSDTYLNTDAVIAAAKRSHADAVHPGYGFLSENAEFAAAVESAGMVWIGPAPETITALGDKVTARQIAKKVGAPLAPGTDRALENAADAAAFATEHGLPIVVKAAHGGGGRGMKIAWKLAEVADAFESAARESAEAFGRSECFVERYLEQPRHLEVQVLGDGRGRVIAVGDRDCSSQRRNQKLIEEAPAPNLSEKQRDRLHRSAEALCSEVNYRGAATVEYLLAADGTMTFLEVNTRLQVEHPVTEMVSGIDLVSEQFNIAFHGDFSLPFTPDPVGHAIELRINAEDPARGFLPTPGKIARLDVPGGPGVRWDSGVRAGDTVQAEFDSLIAKLIVHARDRPSAIARTLTAARELRIGGVATVVPCCLEILGDPAFSTEHYGIHTQWIEHELLPRLREQPRPAPSAYAELERFDLEIDGKLTRLGVPLALLTALGGLASSQPGAEQPRTDDNTHARNAGDTGSVAVTAPAAGTLVQFLITDGAPVSEGDEIAVLSAMKMETRVHAPVSGVVYQLVDEGESVTQETVLARVEPSTESEPST